MEQRQVSAERGSGGPEGVLLGPACVREAPQHRVQERAGAGVKLVVWGTVI